MSDTMTAEAANINALPAQESKYQPYMDTAVIAANVRKDIAAALKSGLLPKGLKTSVTISRFSGGSSISITVKALPAGYLAETTAHVAWELDHPHERFDGLRVPANTQRVLDRLEAILKAYHYDRSDIQSDYFNVNFYAHTDLCWKLEKAHREEIAGAIKACRAAIPVAATGTR